MGYTTTTEIYKTTWPRLSQKQISGFKNLFYLIMNIIHFLNKTVYDYT